MLLAWGTSHLVPTRAVADSFGTISADNRRILVMEWMAEGFAPCVHRHPRRAGDRHELGLDVVYRTSAAVLVALAALTALIGARIPVVWFRICPFVLSGAAAPLLVASFS